MELEIKLPELGSGITAGDVLDVLVAVGDQVENEQGILEIETDKATVTVPSSAAGKVTRILVKRGDSLPIGGTILVLEVAKTAATAPPAPQPRAAAPQATEATSRPAPPLDTTIAPRPGSAVSPPRTPETPAGTTAASEAIPAEGAAVAAPHAHHSAAKSPSQAVSNPAALPTRVGKAPDNSRQLAAGPAVRKFAREVGIDLSTVKGSGNGGRITRDDILNAVRNASQATRGEGIQPPAGERDAWGPIRTEKLSKIRQTIAAKMHESWTSVPRVTNTDDADVTELEHIRQSSKEDYADLGIKLTSLPFVIKSVAMALRAHKILNASIDMENGKIIYKDYVHVGIAVDSERGLVVPSLRNADQLSIPEIARQLQAIAEKVRSSSFSIDDLRGSTFTISNLGAIGGVYSTPIVNTPEVAILLVGRARKLPVVVDDEIVARLMMPLSLSYDHRLVDGGAAARFLNEVIGYLKAPSRLLLAP